MQVFRKAKSESVVRGMVGTALATGESACLMQRLDCVLLIAQGRSLREVAGWFGVGQRSIQRWVHAAYAIGIEGLREHHRGGRPPKLTAEQAQAIRCILQVEPSAFGYSDMHWSGKRLASHVNKCHAINASVRTCQRLIARHKAESSTSRA